MRLAAATNSVSAGRRALAEKGATRRGRQGRLRCRPFLQEFLNHIVGVSCWLFSLATRVSARLAPILLLELDDLVVDVLSALRMILTALLEVKRGLDGGERLRVQLLYHLLLRLATQDFLILVPTVLALLLLLDSVAAFPETLRRVRLLGGRLDGIRASDRHLDGGCVRLEGHLCAS